MTVNQEAQTRPLYEIAAEIRRTWKPVGYAAVPYVDAMGRLDSIADQYHAETAERIVRYFLSNAGMWRGADAKRIKNELKVMVGIKPVK